MVENEFLIEADTDDSGKLTMRVVGELDAATADGLVDALGEWPGLTEYVIDLSACTFIDSGGISGLLNCRRKIGESTPMRLMVSPNVEYVLRLAGLEAYLGLDISAA